MFGIPHDVDNMVRLTKKEALFHLKQTRFIIETSTNQTVIDDARETEKVINRALAQLNAPLN